MCIAMIQCEKKAKESSIIKIHTPEECCRQAFDIFLHDYRMTTRTTEDIIMFPIYSWKGEAFLKNLQSTHKSDTRA